MSLLVEFVRLFDTKPTNSGGGEPAQDRHKVKRSLLKSLLSMFKDTELSRDINQTFKNYKDNLPQDMSAVGPSSSSSNPIDLNVNVQSMAYWPTYQPMEVSIPGEIFKKFYHGKYSGCKLQWQPQLGHCVLRAHFRAANKELKVLLFQPLCLLCFNGRDKISLEDLREATNIEDNTVL